MKVGLVVELALLFRNTSGSNLLFTLGFCFEIIAAVEAAFSSISFRFETHSLLYRSLFNFTTTFLVSAIEAYFFITDLLPLEN